MSHPDDGSTQDTSPTALQDTTAGTSSPEAVSTLPRVVGEYAPPAAAARPSAARRAALAPEDMKDAQDGPSQTSPVTGDSAVSPLAMWSLTVFFSLVVIVALDILLSVWPPTGATAAPVEGVSVLWGLLTLNVSINDRLMLIAIIMGVIGSMIHVLTSFADFVGNRRLAKSWIPWYMVRPVIGSGLALFFYVVFRGGLLTGNDTANVNPFGIAALGGLAGMFSKQATDKLSEVFSTMFNTSSDSGDAQRGGKLEAKAPTRPTATAAQESGD
jgi:hypothetical protein